MSKLPWFRFYTEALDDPKVQRLSPPLFKTWVNLLCVANSHGGKLPPIDDIAFMLRLSSHEAESQLDELILLGLIDIAPDKSRAPHNWSKRQFVSDIAADRVRKYRDKRQASGLPRGAAYTKMIPALKDRDGHGCAYCGDSESPLVVEHMIPTSKGGTDEIDNLCLSCKPCNSGKAGRLPHEAGMTFASATAQAAHTECLMRNTKRNNIESVTPPEQSRAESDTDSEFAAPLPPKGETKQQGFKNGFAGGSFSQAKREEVRELTRKRAEGFGLPVDEILAEAKQASPKNLDAYFQAICRRRLASKLPGIADEALRKAFGPDPRAMAAVCTALMEAP